MAMKKLATITGALCLMAAALPLRAEVQLPNLLSDHAVLQRDRPIHLWGWSTPMAQLTAHFHQQEVRTIADKYGRWSLYLAPEKAGGPYTLTIDGDGSPKTLSDLLVGDVWFASGQSNMEFPLEGFPVPPAPLKNGAQEIAAARHPNMRLLVVEHESSDYPQQDIKASWTECTPETARHFSAVAYFFGREIAEKEDVPVGLIDSAWGGTPGDSWVSMDTLGTNPQLLPAFASRARFADDLADVPRIEAEERREDAAAKAAGKPAPSHPWHPFEDSYAPSDLYNGMVAPFTPMTIKGILWYQGETNSAHDRAPYYHTLLAALIGDWRMHFAQGNLPFLFVQISSFESPGEDWALVREGQRRTLDVANTAMAVTLDIGEANNVHPPDKQTVGHRLALEARHMVYGEAVRDSGPSLREVTTELQPDGSTALRVWFDHAAGLKLLGDETDMVEVAGADHHFVPAEVRVVGSTLLVSAKDVAQPVYVRYGWQSVVKGYIENSDGLPASTFTSEPFPSAQ